MYCSRPAGLVQHSVLQNVSQLTTLCVCVCIILFTLANNKCFVSGHAICIKKKGMPGINACRTSGEQDDKPGQPVVGGKNLYSVSTFCEEKRANKKLRGAHYVCLSHCFFGSLFVVLPTLKQHGESKYKYKDPDSDCM